MNTEVNSYIEHSKQCAATLLENGVDHLPIETIVHLMNVLEVEYINRMAPQQEEDL